MSFRESFASSPDGTMTRRPNLRAPIFFPPINLSSVRTLIERRDAASRLL